MSTTIAKHVARSLAAQHAETDLSNPEERVEVGMAEDIIAALDKIEGLGVTGQDGSATYSAESYRELYAQLDIIRHHAEDLLKQHGKREGQVDLDEIAPSANAGLLEFIKERVPSDCALRFQREQVDLAVSEYYIDRDANTFTIEFER